ncbi:hypothetical protein [Mesorhizobium sp. CCNWLY176]
MSIASLSASADGRVAANDNNPALRNQDVPVFDRGRNVVSLFCKGEWSPPKQPQKRGKPILLENDGPSLSRRINMGIAWYASSKWRDRPAGDNQNWPLGGLLQTEGADGYLALAIRYRHMFDRCAAELRGVDVDSIYTLDQKSTLDPSTGQISYKGAKTVTGKRAKPETAATRAVSADPDKTRKRAKPIAQKWQGDGPLNAAIDARPLLAHLRKHLGALREAFEAAVIGGDTLEAIGRAHWVGNSTGAKGAGRALVFLGFEVLERAWREYDREARQRAVECAKRAKAAGLR